VKGKQTIKLLGAACLTVVLIALLIVGCAKPAPAPAQTVWTLESMWARADIVVQTLPVFTDYVEAKSNGQLKIKIFAQPEIVPDMDIFSATQRGVLDVAHGGGLWALNVPLADMENGLPGMFLFPEEPTFTAKSEKLREFFFESGFSDLLREEYGKHNLYWLDVHIGTEMGIMTTEEVHTLADIKGMSAGIWGPGYPERWLVDLGWGAVPIIPPPDYYMALKLGTIDAAALDEAGFTYMGLDEVAPYWIANTAWALPAMNMLVNMDSWNALSDDLKKVVADGAYVYFQAVNSAYEEEIVAFQRMIDRGEVIILEMDDEYMQKARDTGRKMWDEVAESDPANAQAIELWKKWRGIE